MLEEDDWILICIAFVSIFIVLLLVAMTHG